MRISNRKRKSRKSHPRILRNCRGEARLHLLRPNRKGNHKDRPFYIHSPQPLPLNIPFRHMALTAICFHQFITDIHRMDEIADHGAGRDIFLLLTGNLVAKIAVF